MSEIGVEKFLVETLAEPPFNLEFTVASITNLSCQQMIHLLTMIMAEIDPVHQNIDISDENEQSILKRILEFLRIVKYSPPDENPHLLRSGILDGNPDFLIPVMAWLLAKKDELKVRAYLAKYLVKINLPDDDWILDDDVTNTYQKYEELVETFKCTHKENVKLQNVESKTSSLIEDMTNITHDIDCLRSKLEGMRYRMNQGGEVQDPSMLSVIHSIRLALLKKQELHDEERSEEECYLVLKNKKDELQQLFVDEADNNNQLVNGADFLEKLEQDTEVLRDLVLKKCPQEYELLKRKIHALELVEDDPPESNQDVKDLINKVTELQIEIKKLTEHKLTFSKSSSQELFILRQKSTALKTKKQKLKAELQPISAELSTLKTVIGNHLKTKIKKHSESMHAEEELVEFALQVSNKNILYNQCCDELEELQKEIGILSSTKFIIDGEWRESEKELEDLVTELGLTSFYEESNKFQLPSKYTSLEHQQTTDYLYEVTTNVQQLLEEIKIKKSNLEPILNVVNAERQALAELQEEYSQKKQRFDAANLTYEAGNKEIQLKIDSKRKQWEDKQFKFVQLKCLFAQLNVTRFRVTEEKVSQSLSFHGFRDKLMVKILEQERIQKSLQRDQSQLDEIQAYCMNQKEHWNNMIKLLEWKMQLKEQQDEQMEIGSLIM